MGGGWWVGFGVVGLSTEVLSFYLGDLDTSVGPGTSLWVGSVS